MGVAGFGLHRFPCGIWIHTFVDHLTLQSVIRGQKNLTYLSAGPYSLPCMACA
jgi:hypothetical protein